MKHCNIPVFIPHLGCPHDCVFCDQRSITGQRAYPTREQVEKTVRDTLATLPADSVREIAFFGGSFTGIGEERMTAFLDIAQSFVNAGAVQSIRLSTRPDYISESVLHLLSRYTVRCVELGIQSMSDAVLRASGRGHDAQTARRACRMVREAGFFLIGQMMIGLPASDGAAETATAREIIELGADGARVYPTVVLRNTALCRMAQSGAYVPLTRTQAVERTAAVLDLFDRASLPVIRVGLCATDLLCGTDAVWGNTFCESVGEQARGEVFFRRLCLQLDSVSGSFAGRELFLRCGRGKTSQLLGQKRINADRLCRRYGFSRVTVTEDDRHAGYETEWEISPLPFGKDNDR